MSDQGTVTVLVPLSDEMSAQFAVSPGSVDFARHLIKLHDEKGLDFEWSCEMAKDNNMRPALIGIFVECATRNMTPKTTMKFVEAWRRHFTPSDVEQKGIDAVLKKNQ